MYGDKRIYTLDVFKFVAAVCVICHHYQAVLNVRFEGFNFNNGAFYFGHLVELFFVISGFLVGGNIGKVGETENFDSFFRKRCIRLLPVNALAAAAHSFVIFLQYGGFHFWGWVISAFGLFAVDASFQTYGVNAPCWYVSVLLICYIWFYAITYWGKKKKLPIHWLYAAMVLTGLLIQQRGCALPLLNSNTGRGYFAFFTGLLLKQLTDRYGASGKLQLTAAGLVASFGLIYRINAFFVSEGLSYLLTLFVYPSMIIVAICPVCRRLLSFRWLGILGEVSFGMYLLHNPIIQFLGHIDSTYALSLPIAEPWFMILIIALSVAAAFASLHLIEKPVAKINR